MLAGLGSNCASLSNQLPSVSQTAIELEKSQQARGSMLRYLEHNDRLQTLARKILSANSQDCARTRMDVNIQPARLKDLPESLRPIAKVEFGFDEQTRVLWADARTGVQLGDVLEREGNPAKLLNSQFDPATLQVLRQGEVITPKLETQNLCHYPVKLRYSAAINAYATGRSIIVTTAMMDFASDQELALVIGHELAHNTQGHLRKVLQNRVLALGFPVLTRQFESEADYVGLYYMAHAGFEVEGASDFWRRLSQVSIKSLDTPKTHPITPERYVRLEAAIAEIKARQARGESLQAVKR